MPAYPPALNDFPDYDPADYDSGSDYLSRSRPRNGRPPRKSNKSRKVAPQPKPSLPEPNQEEPT